MSDEKNNQPDRRAILKKTGTAVAAGAIFPGAAAANPGKGKGKGKGNGPGNGKGKEKGNGPGNGKGNGPGEGKGPDGNGPGGGPPFEEPENTNIVFCGCSQVCVCSANCNTVTVLVEGGPNKVMDGTVPDCVEVDEGRIVAVQDTSSDVNPTITCNPNRACGSFEDGTFEITKSGGEGTNEYHQSECTYGTAPQFGARCGEAFLEECSGDHN